MIILSQKKIDIKLENIVFVLFSIRKRGKKNNNKETLKYRSYTVYYIKFQVYTIWVKKKKKF